MSKLSKGLIHALYYDCEKNQLTRDLIEDALHKRLMEMSFAGISYRDLIDSLVSNICGQLEVAKLNQLNSEASKFTKDQNKLDEIDEQRIELILSAINKLFLNDFLWNFSNMDPAEIGKGIELKPEEVVKLDFYRKVRDLLFEKQSETGEKK